MQHETEEIEQIDAAEQTDGMHAREQAERIDLAAVPSPQLWQAISRWKKRAACEDCAASARHAYSDATTPGFFHDKCQKHRAETPDPNAVDLSAFTPSEVAAELSKRAAQGRAARRVLKRCKDCGLPFGSRDMRRHRQVCIRNPRRKKETQSNGH